MNEGGKDMTKNNTKKDRSGLENTDARKLLTKKILYTVITFVSIAAIYLFLRNSPYFRLETIGVIDKGRVTALDTDELLRMYKGKNIFGININSLSSRIERNFPVIREAVVKKILPNKLEIDIIPRVPVAIIKSRGSFPIDRAGMVLSPEILLPQTRGIRKLPAITGFSIWLSPKVGAKLKNPQLQNAFLLLDSLKESFILSDYAVDTIDVSNYKNISFYLENGIEVKIGNENFLDRLSRLKAVLDNPGLDKENIKYVDLRFKDVIIGPK